MQYEGFKKIKIKKPDKKLKVAPANRLGLDI
jgi:hypothetical protein